MILDRIVNEKKKRVEERKNKVSLEKILEMSNKLKGENNNLFRDTLLRDGLSVIGEFKKASPSKGVIVPDFNIEEIVKVYKKLGIDAYSVLTEEDFFMGSDENLKKVKTLGNVPILRKDFVIDFYQIYESKVIGASAVLLIASVLGKRLKDFYEECKKINIEVLVEVHNKEELKIALECDCEIIGINNRNLKNFNTSLGNTEELIKYVPKDKIIVSESGMHTVDDLSRVRGLGVDGVLVGEMFMRNINNNDFQEDFIRFKGER